MAEARGPCGSPCTSTAERCSSRSVQRRGRELAIRLALGATPGAIRALVLRHGLTMMGVGLVAGLAGSAGIAQVVASRLWGVSPFAPSVYLRVSSRLPSRPWPRAGCPLEAWFASRPPRR